MSEDIWFSSDLHFYHKNILKFCPTTRKGKDCIEMGELLIAGWNSRVKVNDRVYLLGDVSFGNVEQTISALGRLNGQIHLVYGNHDNVIRNNAEVRSRFTSVSDYKEIKIGEQKIILFHFPIYEWHQCHRGSYHLHGHTHNSVKLPGRIMDVGVDSRRGDMLPWHYDEIDAILKKEPSKEHHNKKDM